MVWVLKNWKKNHKDIVFWLSCFSRKQLKWRETTGLQTAIISSILNQSGQLTHRLKALLTPNHIMYITSHYLIHLVHDMQDPQFWQKSKVKILDSYGFQETIMCLLGTSKQLGVGEWCISAKLVNNFIHVHNFAFILTKLENLNFEFCSFLTSHFAPLLFQET